MHVVLYLSMLLDQVFNHSVGELISFIKVKL